MIEPGQDWISSTDGEPKVFTVSDVDHGTVTATADDGAATVICTTEEFTRDFSLIE